MRLARWRASRLAVWGLAMSLSAGCAAPTFHWSHRVRLNGRTFVFSRIDSLQEGAEGHKISYESGDFAVDGAGAIKVNGFEIRTFDGGVLLADQRVVLSPQDEVHFDGGMSWRVRSPPARSAPPPTPPSRP